MVRAADYLRKHVADYDDILKKNNMNLADVVRLFEPLFFKLTRSNYYIEGASSR